MLSPLARLYMSGRLSEGLPKDLRPTGFSPVGPGQARGAMGSMGSTTLKHRRGPIEQDMEKMQGQSGGDPILAALIATFRGR